MSAENSRRKSIKIVGGSLAGLSLAGISGTSCMSKPADNLEESVKLKGNLKHSVSRWCYNKFSLEELCEAAKEFGLESVELLNPDEYEVPIKYGLTCAMSFGSPLGIEKGFNDLDLHEQLLKDYEELLPKAADAGLKNVICFSGNRNGISDEEGLENCARGLEPVAKIAQKYNITLVMELLNSKVNHPDYQCDHTAWGVALCEKLGMEEFKLLYDIYHMQIMEGDVIRTIQDSHQYIAHYHTGGVPGRNEIDETQELYYPAIMKAILKTGYKEFIGQEFIPTSDYPLESLKKAVELCDV